MSSGRRVWNLALVLFFAIIHGSQAQVIQITEITFEDWDLWDGETWGTGWIELKNTSSQPLNTGGVFLTLNDEAPWALPSISLNANDYILIWLSGRNQNSVKENLHASFSVTQDNNVFTVYDQSRNILLDSVTIHHKPYWNESRTRFPENSNNWYNTTARTPGYENRPPGPWRRITSYSDFSPRDSAPNAALYFKDKLWILEGWNGGGGEEAAASNIWASTDGSDWELINNTPPFKPYSSYTVFKNKMWAFDGNAYCSVNGTEWSKVASDLPFSTNSRVAALNDTLFLTTGRSIYKSPNGINWTEVTTSAPWEDREFPALVQFQNKLWLYGGGINYNTGNDYYYNDVWSSEDGAHWRKVTEHAAWPGRLWGGFTSYDNKMWLMGGWNYHDLDDSHMGNKNDVWFTEDGITWKQLLTTTIWQPRHAPLVWSSPDGMYLSSGYLNNFMLFNDVWRLDRPENIVRDVFYLKSGEDPRSTSSWGTDTSGTGTPPTAFDYAYQNFIISNDDSISFVNDINIPGEGSNLIFGNGQDSIYVSVTNNVNIAATARLNSLATIQFEGQQRTPHLRSVDEKNTVIIGDNVTLDASAIGQLIVKGPDNVLARASFIRKSVTIEKDGALKGDTPHLQYAPAGSLIFEGTPDHVVSNAEWPSKRPPGNVIVNCDCLVSKEGSVSSDSLVFSNGLLEISNGVLSSTHIARKNKQSYVITGSDGYLETVVNETPTVFPIGTSGSYNPIEIKMSKADGKERRFKANAFAIDDVENSEYAINVGWTVLHTSNEVPEYEITFHWNSKNEAEFASPGSLILVSPNETKDITSPAGTTTAADNAKKIVSAVQTKDGTYFLKDLRVEKHPNDVAFFPNPSSDHLVILFNTNQKVDVALQLLNLSGQVVYSNVLPSGNRNYNISWNKEIPTGMYLLKIDTGDRVSFNKIIID